MARPKGELAHGTINGYANHKCRCDACKAAAAIHRKPYNAARATKNTGQTAYRVGLKEQPAYRFAVHSKS